MSERPVVNDIPETALLWLDRDVAAWLHRVADRDFGGDRQLALNGELRATMAADPVRDDPWALVRARAMVRQGLDPSVPHGGSQGPQRRGHGEGPVQGN